MTERRRDPLTGSRRTVASHRQERTFLPAEDHCPLCPTYDRGAPTEIPWADYEVAVFDNRFPSLMAVPPAPDVTGSWLMAVESAAGATEVVVYSDDHHA